MVAMTGGKDWRRNQIAEKFQSAGPVSKIYILRDSEGKQNGNVIMFYEDETNAKSCIDQFNNKTIDNCLITAKVQTEEPPVTPRPPMDEKKMIFLMNLPFDADFRDIKAFVE